MLTQNCSFFLLLSLPAAINHQHDCKDVKEKISLMPVKNEVKVLSMIAQGPGAPSMLNAISSIFYPCHEPINRKFQGLLIFFVPTNFPMQLDTSLCVDLRMDNKRT